MYEDLKGKTALITGAGRKTGMGYAIAGKLASNGVHVIVTDIASKEAGDSLRAIADELAADHGVTTLAVTADVTDTGSVAAMAEKVKAVFPRLDILCNNAGAAFGVPNTFNAYDEALWMKTVDVNMHGPFRVTRALLPLMLGHPCSVINTASRAGKFTPIFNGAYAVAKAGLIMLTKVMAKELAGAGIRVNAICPAQIRTDLLKWQLELEAAVLEATIEEREKDMCASIPLGRIGTTSEIADLVAFLASDESRYITGQAVNICGGQLMEL